MAAAGRNTKVPEADLLEAMGMFADHETTSPNLADHFGVTRQAIMYRMKELAERGIVEERKVTETSSFWVRVDD